MAIYNLYLDKDYISLVKDLYKTIVILIIFQILVYYSKSQKNILNSALTGTLLNDEFLTLVIFILIGISAYYLVFEKILSIN